MKTGEGLALFAEKAAIAKTPYIYATFGQILTERKLSEVRRLYPERMSEKRYQYARGHYVGKRTNDCYGLVKRYKWSGGGAENPSLDDTPIYDGSSDVNANTAYQKATVKGKISTIPEVRGLIVWKPGHVGVYLGNGRVAEARGFDFGTVITKLSDRPWTNWFQEVGINYDQHPTPTPGGGFEVKVKTLKRNADGSAMVDPNVLVFQSMMNTLKIRDDDGRELVEDSHYGKRSEQACKRFQKLRGLTVDGKCGPATWNEIANG
jgi:peptidoglycan hydrolase-like protein with peptidoglycan-binding domain